MFQSTRPYGARLCYPGGIRLPQVFQSTRPYGARPVLSARTSQLHGFQSTRPYGARRYQYHVTAPVVNVLFQSTRPYGARPLPIKTSSVTADSVSIHAPVRGATDGDRSYDGMSAMFQSTRPYGARPVARCFRRIRLSPYCFNPRARTGRDVLHDSNAGKLHVSIHAPVRGATY